ncbi:glycosyltransferase family 2 protein [Rhizobium oryziradicis]|uniref:Galactosyl transferase n=1 Tax=Rhizobium oryziradicis TaxID=1867956 RepID=A0A1Q8ZU67_9HYPH|nr:glycosyltransferase family A protein [Rhizobium oryziradicis]OLP45478.1 galactosyl transferase [Rhizobium oryziradicis]
MMLLTFIIPVRHPDNARDWGALCARLSQTIASIAAQTHDDWRCVIVANEGASLPPMPERFFVERVTFAPNPNYDLQRDNLEAGYDAVRLDKGRRILSGMLAASDSDYFMVVDDDDFVSARLVDYVAQHRGANGWKINLGFLWNEGGQLMMGYDNFAHFCGTSLIIRSDLYQLPSRFEDCSETFIKTMLGSHKRIADALAERGNALLSLPFRGAVYRIGHAGAHSKSGSILGAHIFCRETLKDVRKLVHNLRRLRMVDSAMRQEFGLPGRKPSTADAV